MPESCKMFLPQDQQGAVTKAVKKAAKESLAQGRKEGLQEGLQQGLQEGLQQGLQQKAYEIARKMLDVLDDRAIADMTGLTLEELQSLRSSLHVTSVNYGDT